MTLGDERLGRACWAIICGGRPGAWACNNFVMFDRGFTLLLVFPPPLFSPPPPPPIGRLSMDRTPTVVVILLPLPGVEEDTTPPPVQEVFVVVAAADWDGLNIEEGNLLVVVIVAVKPTGSRDPDTLILALEAAAANTSAMELLKVSGMAPELDSELLKSWELLLRWPVRVAITAAATLLLLLEDDVSLLSSLARLGVADTPLPVARLGGGGGWC